MLHGSEPNDLKILKEYLDEAWAFWWYLAKEIFKPSHFNILKYKTYDDTPYCSYKESLFHRKDIYMVLFSDEQNSYALTKHVDC